MGSALGRLGFVAPDQFQITLGIEIQGPRRREMRSNEKKTIDVDNLTRPGPEARRIFATWNGKQIENKMITMAMLSWVALDNF